MVFLQVTTMSNDAKVKVNKKKVTFALNAEKSVEVPKANKTTRSSRAKTGKCS